MSATKKRDGYWLTIGEACTYLDLHANTLKRIPPSELPYMRVTARGDRRYRAADLEAYVRARMVTK